ncbi:predicted GPI-anchored protein 58 isoform X2 [Cygnus olor]|uniref:predicted GPI-anchored protein 58 isoform X2 n=2 Tax=Cygnus olor TaxID=8869 RepID=UPI001ADE5BB0|nr:predicted GPI-anchored protein 58 isoform X2 [Cygnus olor]
MPAWDTASREPGHGGFWALGTSKPYGGCQVGGSSGAGCAVGQEEPPRGARDVAWTSTAVLSTSTSFPARSRFPPASRARRGAGAAGGEPGTALSITAWGAAPCRQPEPARDRPGRQQEHTARMEPAKPPPSKRMAPAPPVPAKTKPALGLPSKPSGPQPGTSAEMERDRAGDPDTDGFSALQVTTAKLSHPTATRPRVPGRRPPSMAGGGLGPPCAELCPHLPATGQGPEQRLALEDLKAEVRSLHILVDLMRGQHLRDLEDVRLELQHERTKREALQVEIERVRKALPC